MLLVVELATVVAAVAPAGHVVVSVAPSFVELVAAEIPVVVAVAAAERMASSECAM